MMGSSLQSSWHGAWSLIGTQGPRVFVNIRGHLPRAWVPTSPPPPFGSLAPSSRIWG